jgi:hypothetical protein
MPPVNHFSWHGLHTSFQTKLEEFDAGSRGIQGKDKKLGRGDVILQRRQNQHPRIQSKCSNNKEGSP